MERRRYKVRLVINDQKVNEVIIDPHYEKRHKSSIDDQIILELVNMLDGGEFPRSDSDDQFEYFVTDEMNLKGKLYKLIWLLEKDKLYIGVINAYRRKT